MKIRLKQILWIDTLQMTPVEELKERDYSENETQNRQ